MPHMKTLEAAILNRMITEWPYQDAMQISYKLNFGAPELLSSRWHSITIWLLCANKEREREREKDRERVCVRLCVWDGKCRAGGYVYSDHAHPFALVSRFRWIFASEWQWRFRSFSSSSLHPAQYFVVQVQCIYLTWLNLTWRNLHWIMYKPFRQFGMGPAYLGGYLSVQYCRIAPFYDRIFFVDC